MGALCSCLHVSDARDNDGSNSLNSDDCLCPVCFFRKLMNKHGNLFKKEQIHVVSPCNQPAPSPNPEVHFDHSSDASEFPSRGSHVRVECRYLQEQCNEVRQSQGTSHSPPVRHLHHPCTLKSECSVRSPELNPDPSANLTPLAEDSVFADSFPLSDDENVCPTCLEEYTPENPKITAECSHHYHLSCIYEWIERSNYCPACNKLMVFDESN